MKTWKIWRATCKHCAQDMIGFELLQRSNSKKGENINWNHADGNFYRHGHDVIGIFEVAEGEF